MILGVLRMIYFFGPVLALALVLLPERHRLSWSLWIVGALIVAAHAVAYLTALESNSIRIERLALLAWGPVLATSLIASFTRKKWQTWFANKSVAQTVIILLCALPSVLLITLVG